MATLGSCTCNVEIFHDNRWRTFMFGVSELQQKPTSFKIGPKLQSDMVQFVILCALQNDQHGLQCAVGFEVFIFCSDSALAFVSTSVWKDHIQFHHRWRCLSWVQLLKHLIDRMSTAWQRRAKWYLALSQRTNCTTFFFSWHGTKDSTNLPS